MAIVQAKLVKVFKQVKSEKTHSAVINTVTSMKEKVYFQITITFSLVEPNSKVVKNRHKHRYSSHPNLPCRIQQGPITLVYN